MPLFDLGSQLNSICNLKSPNFLAVMISAPWPVFSSTPFSMTQFACFSELNTQPSKFFPLKRGVGLPHTGSDDRLRAGARTPVHVAEVPSAPFAVPTRRPSDTRA